MYKPEKYCGNANTNPNFLPISIELYPMNAWNLGNH